MEPQKKVDEYTRYCITQEGKEYLRKLLAKNEQDSSALEEDECEVNMQEEIDFENLRIIDDEIEELSDEEFFSDEYYNDEFFKLNEDKNDDDYDFWKETL
ncbi:MAG: hypothetical protein JSS63_15030 [Bacteroidetes bacterium]|nr:hypothetical protein [Bacteroidota bacterium]MBX7046242.1 hypothetical protein [Ignavibacteria bacterium]